MGASAVWSQADSGLQRHPHSFPYSVGRKQVLAGLPQELSQEERGELRVGPSLGQLALL